LITHNEQWRPTYERERERKRMRKHVSVDFYVFTVFRLFCLAFIKHRCQRIHEIKMTNSHRYDHQEQLTIDKLNYNDFLEERITNHKSNLCRNIDVVSLSELSWSIDRRRVVMTTCFFLRHKVVDAMSLIKSLWVGARFSRLARFSNCMHDHINSQTIETKFQFVTFKAT